MATNPKVSDHPDKAPYLITLDSNYELSRDTKKNQLSITCQKCKRLTRLWNNKSVQEEYLGISGYYEELKATASCKNSDCSNYGIGVLKEPGKYIKNGQNKYEGQRYKCKLCNKSCTVKKTKPPYSRQKYSYKNIDIFMNLVNKVPLNRILELNNINPKVLYDRIDYFYAQCRKFARAKNKQIKKKNFQSIRLSSDRQYYTTNWRSSKNMKNVILYNLSTVDESSSYVFLSSLNFDPTAKVKDINYMAWKYGDYERPIPWRIFARYRLDDDSDASALDPDKTPYKKGAKETKGMQIINSYTMMAHFIYIKELFSSTTTLTLYNDDENGISNVIKNVFRERILDNSLEAFIVSIDKTIKTKSRKKREKASKDAASEFKIFKSENPLLSDFNAKEIFIENKWDDFKIVNNMKWHTHPTPGAEEPGKAIHWITERNGIERSKISPLMVMATLNATDRLFLSLRRRITFFERSFSTASGATTTGAKWNGYGAYNPAVLVKVLEIFRIYYNFVLTGKDGKTPAQRLGVAKKAYTVRDILYYKG